MSFSLVINILSHSISFIILHVLLYMRCYSIFCIAEWFKDYMLSVCFFSLGYVLLFFLFNMIVSDHVSVIHPTFCLISSTLVCYVHSYFTYLSAFFLFWVVFVVLYSFTYMLLLCTLFVYIVAFSYILSNSVWYIYIILYSPIFLIIMHSFSFHCLSYSTLFIDLLPSFFYRIYILY